MSHSNIFSAISNEYFHLTGSEKKVADYVQAHRTDVQFMSISELAEECGVADATVSRFCRRMNLRGYSDFKLSLAKAEVVQNPTELTELPHTEQPDSIAELSAQVFQANVLAMRQSMERLNPKLFSTAVDMLVHAERVWCMGQGGSMILAEEAAHQFSTVCNKFFSVADSHTQVSRVALFDSRDVLFFFSYSGSTKDMMGILTLARSRGAKTILLTRFPKSPGAALADVILQCGSDEGPLQMGSMPARVAQLYLVDLLFQEFCRRDAERTGRNREIILDALTEKHL